LLLLSIVVIVAVAILSGRKILPKSGVPTFPIVANLVLAYLCPTEVGLERLAETA
jgi:galactitol-specific phosphotransferase system IIC component